MANDSRPADDYRRHQKLSSRPSNASIHHERDAQSSNHRPVMKRSGYGEAVSSSQQIPTSRPMIPKHSNQPAADVMKRSGSRPDEFKRPVCRDEPSVSKKSCRQTDSHRPAASKSHSKQHKRPAEPSSSNPFAAVKESKSHSSHPKSPDASSSTGIDIFPTLADKRPSRLDPKVPSTTSSLLSFIVFLRGLRIYFHMLPPDVWTANIHRLYAESQKCNPIEYGRLDWARAEHRLDKTPTSAGRQNEDVRLGFRWDNIFLVKMFFTFGQRTPDPGTVHVIQTSAAPILYYEFNPCNKFTNSNTSPKKRHYRTSAPASFVATSKGFSSYDQFLYDRYVLQPFSIYRVRPGTTYVILTCQKSLFQLDVIHETTADDLERRGAYRFASPTADRVLRPNASMGYLDRPPATPVWSPPESETSDITFNHHDNNSQILEVPSQPTEAERNLMEEMFQCIQPSPEIPADTQETAQLMLVSTGDNQLTWIVQPPLQQQQQSPPQQLTTTVTKDAAVNTTEEWTCCSCVAKKTSGLGIARKRIEMCCSPQTPKKKRRRIEQQPLDLSCAEWTAEFPESYSMPNLPPAPSTQIRDDGLYKPPPDSDDEEEEDELPHDEEDELPHDEEDELPQVESDELPQVESDELPQVESDELPHDEEDELPHDEEDELPHEEEDELPHEELDMNFLNDMPDLSDFLNEDETAVSFIPRPDDDNDMFWEQFM